MLFECFEHELLLSFSDIPGSCGLVDPARLSCFCLFDALLRCLGGFRLDLMSAGGQFSGKTDRVFFIMEPPPGFFKD